ncbi:MAG TPA: hypothetical protein VFT78_14670 [Hanamia sp.]|nr:hypothetical protein [Hanamia sp.]
MQEAQTTTSRKKFLMWSAAVFSTFTISRFVKVPKRKRSQTVKMLTQEGNLVEIDRKFIASPGKRITNLELQHWVNK